MDPLRKIAETIDNLGPAPKRLFISNTAMLKEVPDDIKQALPIKVNHYLPPGVWGMQFADESLVLCIPCREKLTYIPAPPAYLFRGKS